MKAAFRTGAVALALAAAAAGAARAAVPTADLPDFGRVGPVAPLEEGGHSLEIGARETLLKARPAMGEDLGLREKCGLRPGVTLELAEAPMPVHGSYLYVRLKRKVPGCEFKEGYIFAPHVAAEGGPFRICEKPWERAPGTADYTLVDSFTGRSLTWADRSQGETLLGNPNFQVLDFCERAMALRHCFEQTLRAPDRPEAARVRTWAAARGLDGVRAFMAIAAQETALGTLKDRCWYGTCNGIGLVQVITAVSPEGERLSTYDPRWAGVTHNILTNLSYGLRVFAEKSGRAATLWDLAYLYNGSAGAAHYADKVAGYYRQLGGCGI